MPFLSARNVEEYNLSITIPEDHWNYLYDMMTEEWIYIRSPITIITSFPAESCSRV